MSYRRSGVRSTLGGTAAKTWVRILYSGIMITLPRKGHLIPSFGQVVLVIHIIRNKILLHLLRKKSAFKCNKLLLLSLLVSLFPAN